MKIFSNKGFFVAIFFLSFSLFISVTHAELTSVPISVTIGKSFNPQLSVNGDNIYVVWTDDSPGNKEIFFSKSFTDNLNFDEPINLSNNNKASAFPRMEIVNENIFVTWYDYSLGKSEIYFSHSIDNGKTFETKVISNNAGASYNPWIKTDGKNVYVVWNDETPYMTNINVQGPENVDLVLGDLDILIAISHDSGQIFEIKNLSDSKDSQSWDPRIAISGNHVYVVWNEKTPSGSEIFFSMSNDKGQTFSKPLNVSKSNLSSKGAGILVLQDNIFIIWNEAGEIFFSASNDNGNSFSTPEKISLGSKDSSITRDTQMVILGSDVFVVWYSNSDDAGVFLTKIMDSGKYISQPIQIANFSYQLDAQIASNNNNLHTVFSSQDSKESNIFLRSSHDFGKSFTSLQKLSMDQQFDSALSTLGPQIVATENETFVIFESKHLEGSDLFLAVVENEPLREDGTLMLQTSDKTVDILIGYGEFQPRIENKTIFQIEFFDHQSGEHLKNVNYSFEISDFEGNLIHSSQNQLALDGKAIQDVQFSQAGSANIKFKVINADGNLPNELSYRGVASAVITVIPEFPFGIFGLMGMVIGILIIIFKISPKSYLK